MSVPNHSCDEHKDGHAQLAQLLVEREVIFAEDVEKIFGKRPWTSRTEEILSLNEESAREEEAKKQAEAEKNKEQDAPADDEEQTSSIPVTSSDNVSISSEQGEDTEVNVAPAPEENKEDKKDDKETDPQ
jgi:hypothetical protein